MYAPFTVIKDNVDVENDQWPEEAQKIIEEAGLEPNYRELFKEVKIH